MSRHTVSIPAAFVAVCAALLFPLAACESGGGGGSDTGALDDGSADTGAAAADPCASCGADELCWAGVCQTAEQLGCDVVGFHPTAEAAFTGYAGGALSLNYVASSGDLEPPYEKLVIKLSHDDFFEDGAPRTGTFDLAEMNDENCEFCVQPFGYCNGDGCGFTFVPTEGEVEILSPGEPGVPFRGEVRNARFTQVWVDASGNYKELGNADTWCIDSFEFDIEVPELSAAEGHCVEPGTGEQIGDNIKDYTLTNCLGEEINLHSRCGLTKAVWLVAVAGWCGACTTFVPQVAAQWQEQKQDGLDAIILLGETSSGAAPTLADCKQYAISHDAPPAIVFIDNKGGQAWGNTFDAIDNYSSGGLSVPWNAILDGDSMEYVWSSTAGTGSMYQWIDDLLAK